MLNYRDNKERIKVNEYGSLYVEHSKISDNVRPVIYIGGQMEHRCHVLEQTGYTFDHGHNMFSGSWFYDYSIFKKDKNQFNTKNFAENLLAALGKVGIGDVDLVTESYGGLIGAYASGSPLIHKVVAIHPPILGTPLADKKMIEYAIKYLELEQRIIARLVSVVVNNEYGFEKENSKGLYDSRIMDATDLSKLVVVSSNIDYESEKNEVAKKLYKLILELTGKQSDGVVIFDKEELTKLGVSYVEEDDNLCHFDAGSKENIENAKVKVLGR